jgi:protein disulfide-isomerase
MRPRAIRRLPGRLEEIVAASGWVTGYEAALATAKAEKKLVLADFTGSDWCGWCKKLKAEVFDQPAFQEWAQKNVVLLELDYPAGKPMPPELKQQNDALQRKYRIEGYPTILFLDATGEPVGVMGYQPGGPAPWTRDADAILARAKK